MVNPGFTAREIEVLYVFFAERKTKPACQRLGITMATFKNHLYKMLDKTGMSNSIELFNWARKEDII